MTSYSIIAPLLLVRFQDEYHAWSPYRYGPTYHYDLVIEREDNQHPMMNMEYIDFLHRVTDSFDEIKISNTDMLTDFHSATPLDERGTMCYGVRMNNSIVSPLFFIRADVELYLQFLRDEFIVLRPYMDILEIPHDTI